MKTYVLATVTVMLAIAAVACSDDDGPIAAGGGSSSSSSSGGSSGNQEGGASSSSGDVQFPERLCEALPQTGDEVQELGAWGAPPTALGGTVVPGTYVLNELVVYGGTPPAPLPGEDTPAAPPPSGKAGKVTLYISGNTMRFQESRGDFGALPATDSTRGLSFTAGATSFETKSQCPSAGNTASLGFTAVGSAIAINVDATHREIYKRAAQ